MYQYRKNKTPESVKDEKAIQREMRAIYEELDAIEGEALFRGNPDYQDGEYQALLERLWELENFLD